MNEKVKAFYGDEKAVEDPTKIEFTRGNKCPGCGKEFQALPPLEPNTTQKEFYGGRIKFFKKVECDCGAKYNLCIERIYNSKEGRDELRVIDMIVLDKESMKPEAVLATIGDLDEKVDILCLHTLVELQKMCESDGIKYKSKATKIDLAKLLLAKNPNMVRMD